MRGQLAAQVPQGAWLCIAVACYGMLRDGVAELHCYVGERKFSHDITHAGVAYIYDAGSMDTSMGFDRLGASPAEKGRAGFHEADGLASDVPHPSVARATLPAWVPGFRTGRMPRWDLFFGSYVGACQHLSPSKKCSRRRTSALASRLNIRRSIQAD